MRATVLSIAVALACAASQASEKVVAVSEFAPFVSKVGDSFVGFDVDLIKEIGARGGWAPRFVTAQAVGDVLSMVASNEADLAICGITITSRRYGKVAFSQPYFDSGLQLMVSKEAFDKSIGFREKWDAIRPILRECLVLLLAFMTVFAHAIWLAERKRGDMLPSGYFKGIGMAYWWAVVTCSTVGYGDVFPKSRLGRLIGALVIVVGIAWFGYFMASLTSMITVIKQENPPLKTLADMKGKSLVTERGTTASEYLASSGFRFTEVDNYEDACRMVSEHKADGVVFDYPALLRYANSDDRVMLVGGMVTVERYGIAIPHSSPMADEINSAIVALLENGQYDKIYAKWFGKAPGE